MLKSQGLLKAPSELIAIQKLFLSEVPPPDHLLPPLELPFFNFVCYTIDLFTEFTKSTHEITLNLFIIDYHLRKYSHPVQLYRRFTGYLASWKKYSDFDEAKLFISFLGKGRNERKSIRLFLKLRKILLKSINQKVLQQINLSHEDAVTIVHTINLISVEQKRALTKKINEHFITKNVKYVNSAKFNSAVICEFFLEEINDRGHNIDKFSSNLTNKINRILEKQNDSIQEFEEEEISLRDSTFRQEEPDPEPSKNINPKTFDSENKQNIKKIEQAVPHEKSLVNLDQCMRELSILKERDLQIDNRFKKLNLSREDDI